MKLLLIIVFVAVPVAFAIWTIPLLRRAFNDYRANPWKPKPWNDDD